jgi:predicted polyphosphate/ATP-dependent NAD kinase
MRRIGFVVNPIAGMGGRVGLKGTDGKVEQAREMGAEMRAPDRGRDALRAVDTADVPVEILTYSGLMGEREARDAGFDPTVLGDPEGAAGTDADTVETTPADTRAAVEDFVAADVDVILFTGGDGTAVDVAETLTELGSTIPILGCRRGSKFTLRCSV